MESSGAVEFGAHHSFERVAILIYPGNRTVGIICDGSADKRLKTGLGQPEFALASRPKLGCAEATFLCWSADEKLVGAFVVR